MSDNKTFDSWEASRPVCEVCEEKLYGGSHYHCGCGSKDTTGMTGHYVGIHFEGGKIVHTEFHHCPPGNCELTNAK